MKVFAGYHPWESYRCGATGYVSVFANIAPGLSRDMFVETVERNDGAAGLAIYRRVMPLLDAISGDLYVSATKAALDMMGLQAGPPRAPRLRLPKDRERALAKVLGELDIVPRAAAQ
jgi:4-hydroxy-tetrahydrodipicolinate synthase